MKTLATSELEGFITMQWSDDTPNQPVFKSNKGSLFSDISEEASEEMLTRFLPKFDNVFALIFREVKYSQVAL